MEDTSTIIDTNDKSIIINNISGYTFQIIDNNLHLTPICEYLKESEVYRHELKGSEIIEAKFNGKVIRNKYIDLRCTKPVWYLGSLDTTPRATKQESTRIHPTEISKCHLIYKWV